MLGRSATQRWVQACEQPEITEAVVLCSFRAFALAVLCLEGLFKAAADAEPPEVANRRLSAMLANPLMQGSTAFANHLATLYRLSHSSTQQVRFGLICVSLIWFSSACHAPI